MTDTLEDTQFGPLLWEQGNGWWSGQSRLDENDEDSEAMIYIHAADEHRTITESSRRAWDEIRRSDRRMRQKASDELREVYNGKWNNDERIEAEEFMKRLKLNEVLIFADGSAEVYYGDGEMFGGHVIIVSMGEGGLLTDAFLAG